MYEDPTFIDLLWMLSVYLQVVCLPILAFAAWKYLRKE